MLPAQPDGAQQRGVFTSNLSTAEFAAIRSVGFSPLGLVIGNVVASVGWVNAACGGRRQYTASQVYTLAERQRALTDPRATALQRLRDECVALGADGTAMVPIGRGQPASPPTTLSIMRLDRSGARGVR